MTRDGDLAAYLRDFGWRDVDRGSRGDPGAEEEVAADPVSEGDLPALATAASDCRKCRLAAGRTNVVFGIGDPAAQIMFIGEGPGADEDRLGEPFVGRAGQLLNSMIRAMGLRREDVYIANVVKCRPPRNRDPQPDEVAACLPYLARQIELINPAVLVTLGRVAASHLLGTKTPISSYRGRWQRWQERDVMPTFHPAYLLRSPSQKPKAWADLKSVLLRLRDR